MKIIACLVALVCLAGCDRQPSAETAPRSGAEPETGPSRSVVVSVRDPKSGMCSLKADSALCKAERPFTFLSLWKYAPDTEQWSRVHPELTCSAVIRPAPTGHQTLLELTGELGLFWAWFEEDGKKIGTLIYSGAILPNDLSIGPDKAGFIRSGIPYKDHATAAYVPDPKLHCK